MKKRAILASERLGQGPWKTPDPFLFAMHHVDHYPAANEHMGPDAPLVGRPIGQDFSGKDGWSMYHGRMVPGFPEHPHVGFETVTIARQGFIDHSDSLGATARFGNGDVQWLTAGKGVRHSEMFPLLRRDDENTTELFQLWLNLPRSHKRAEPSFSMFWKEDIPLHVEEDERGKKTEVAVVAGGIGDKRGPKPPPSSWASQEGTDVAIWTIRMSPGAQWTLPPTEGGSNRSLYFFRGSSVRIDGEEFSEPHRVDLQPDSEVELEGCADEVELLLLQGKPIAERVVQYGPFVANSQGELRIAMMEYQATEFGGWPWDTNEPVHPRDAGRFARLPDGSVIRPG